MHLDNYTFYEVPMNIRYFSLLALLVIPSTLSLAMDKPEGHKKAAPAKDAQAVPDLKTTLAKLSEALETGNEEEIAQCASNLAYHNNVAPLLFPVIKKILDGKTALDDREKSWTLASFTFAFVGTPYYDQICQAITAFRIASDGQPPKRKLSGNHGIEERINRAIETRNAGALFELLDECETAEQRALINSALSMI